MDIHLHRHGGKGKRGGSGGTEHMVEALYVHTRVPPCTASCMPVNKLDSKNQLNAIKDFLSLFRCQICTELAQSGLQGSLPWT